MKTGNKIYLKQIKKLFDNIPEAVYVSDIETYEIIYINKYLLNSLNIKTYNGEPCYKVLQGLDSPCGFCTNGSLSDQAITWTHKNYINNKTYRCIDKIIYIGENGNPARLECAIDITDEVNFKSELLETKKQLEKKLKEKEILIKEIHHRVKNNNQLLMSLLHLQEMKTRSKAIKASLSKIIERINAISITYNSLYLNENLNNINLSKHIDNVISNITASFVDYDDIIIEKNIEEDIITHNISKITSIGLIINELLSNCIKHAFKNCKGKTIKINLIKNGDKAIFILEDNGNGLPNNFNVKKRTTMGTLLINALVKQLNAKIKYESEKGVGTKVTINFDLK